jgi:hypothetical protein
MVWPGTGAAFNPDYGIRVACESPSTGLFGRVTQRVRVNGVYKPGTSGIDGVTVSVPGQAPVITANGGHWALPNATGGPHRVTFTPPSTFSSAVAVNVTIPPGHGVRIDTPLEKAFTLPMGSSYTTFLDYSRGRTIFHVVDVDTQHASVKTDLSQQGPSGSDRTLVQTASALGAAGRVLINGSYFIPGAAVGYFFSLTSAPDTQGFVPSVVPDGGPGRMYQTNTNGQSPRITLELPRYGNGFGILAWYEGLTGASDERIALAPLGSPLSTFATIAVPSGKRGHHTFPAVPPGTYVARVLRNNSTVLTAQSATFVVGRNGGDIRVSTDSMYSIPNNGVIVVSYLGLPAAGYHIGITAADSGVSTTPIQTVQLNDTTGQVTLSVPASAGLYEVRAYAANNTVVATSNTINVKYPIEPLLTAPLLAITGASFAQSVRIVQNTPANFESNTDPWSTITLPPPLSIDIPLYDTNPHDGDSDISFGFQSWPTVLANGDVIASEHADETRFDAAWSRTAVGVSGTRMFLVVADGEGIPGRHGATFNQLGEFFRDALSATDAMNLDGGWSTEMVLWDANGPRTINTITGEDGSVEANPFTHAFIPSVGVPNFLRVGQ